MFAATVAALSAAPPAAATALDNGDRAWAQRQYTLAVHAYLDAAAENLPGAMRRLAVAYEFGLGIAADAATAAEWLQRAAALDDPAAQTELALWYATGHIVPHDDARAVQTYRRAARRGFLPAQYFLAQHLERGDGVRRNLTEADAWYRVLLLRDPSFTWALDGRRRVEPQLNSEELYTAEQRANQLLAEFVTPFE